MSAYIPVGILLLLVIGFVFGSLVASKFLAVKKPTLAKEESYECGIVSNQPISKHIPVKFYVVAIAFIILDIEIIFIYPYTTIMAGDNAQALNTYGLLLLGFFTMSLLIPFAYLISSKALDWAGRSEITEPIKSEIFKAQSLQEVLNK